MISSAFTETLEIREEARAKRWRIWMPNLYRDIPQHEIRAGWIPIHYRERKQEQKNVKPKAGFAKERDKLSNIGK